MVMSAMSRDRDPGSPETGHSAHVSPTTLGKYAHEYERNYEGRTITMGPHLALGRGSPVACCRIYFSLDDERHVFVVGHVGNHLSDSTSG